MQDVGLTRLEVSIHCSDPRYDPLKTHGDATWHRKVQRGLSELVEHALNDETETSPFYRSLSIPRLLSSIARTPVNLVAIGKEACWVINARTSHKQHFIGTRLPLRLFHYSARTMYWERLRSFVEAHSSAKI